MEHKEREYTLPEPIPVKRVVDDPTHPLHEIMKELIRKLESGEVDWS
jgi:hypothetical protein